MTIQPTVHKLLCPQDFWVAILEKGHYGLVPKENISEEYPSHIGHM